MVQMYEIHYANAAYNFNQLTDHYHINPQLSVKR